jgi:hypothetical protein
VQIEMSVQGGCKRSEASRIGHEPQTNRQQIVESCYKELVAMAKTIGQYNHVSNRFNTPKLFVHVVLETPFFRFTMTTLVYSP